MSGKQGIDEFSDMNTAEAKVFSGVTAYYQWFALELVVLISTLEVMSFHVEGQYALLVGMMLSFLAVIFCVQHIHHLWIVATTVLSAALIGFSFWSMNPIAIHWYLPILLFSIAVVIF